MATAAEVALKSRDAMMATLEQVEGQDDAAMLARYREKARLNKATPGKRRTLRERQADAMNDQGGEAFKQSEQRIKATEQLTSGLRRRRAKCQEDIDADRAALRRLDARIAEARRKADAVTKTLTQRRMDRERLAKVLADSQRESAGLVSQCGAWTDKNRRNDRRRQRHFASQLLRSERGFSCDVGTTCSRAEALQRRIYSDSRRSSSLAASASLPILSSSSSRAGRTPQQKTTTPAT